MKFGVKKLSSSVRLALSLGAVIAAGASGTAFAQDNTSSQPPGGSQDTTTSAAQNPKTLETITVTGSHIRRVDLETASPVVTIDRQAIEATGKQTLGDLVQQLPAMTGGNVNPQVNNGGGTGSSSIGLRGLGPNRSLVLIDGQRVLNGDPNTIPANMIERIEVLTDGASAVYGSDAIGGVVNFILRKDYQGAQFTANWGESDRADASQSGYSFTFGQTSDKGSIMGGVEYVKQDGVQAANRKISANSISLTGSSQTPMYGFVGGSPSSPYGNVQIPKGLQSAFGCDSKALARNPGSSGLNSSDYHCYQNSGAATDKYNYATVNLILTPSERTNVFINGTYTLNEHVSAYLNGFHNKSSTAFQLAPGVYGSPYGANISADSYYNPFGTRALGAAGAANDYKQGGLSFKARLQALGNRGAAFGASTDQVSTGLKGGFTVLERDWEWNAGLTYGHFSRTTTTLGLPNTNLLYTGPSYLDPTTGVVTCGTPTAPVSGCDASFNPFALDSPGSKAALAKAGAAAVSQLYSQEKIWHADMNGGLFDLPAGTVQLALGASYRQEHSHSTVDPVLLIDPATGNCVLGSQCSAGLQGGFNVKEGYAEAFIPVLKDLPGVQALNVTIGDRYSKFSTFGSTNNFKFALEWKPIDDLLLRGTMAEVFRAPSIGEVYGAPSSDAPAIESDPCDGYTGGGNPACVNVPVDGSFRNQNVIDQSQLTTVAAGSKYAGFPIKAEQGKSFDLGAVYNPSWIPGLSTTVDVWHVYLNDIITAVGVQSVLNLCAAGQTVYCPFIDRYASGPNQGQLTSLTTEPTGNLGGVKVGGVDASLNYKLPEFGYGNFSIGMNGTYLKYYDQATAPGTSANTYYHNSGHFMPNGSAPAAACPGGVGGCLFPRVRAQGSLNWQMGGWDASYRLRFISQYKLGSQDPTQDVHPAGGAGDGIVLHYPSTTYSDISLGYNIVPINTRVDFGVNNLFDKDPPMLYANNTLNANTDPSDFDLLGRYFWGRVTVKF